MNNLSKTVVTVIALLTMGYFVMRDFKPHDSEHPTIVNTTPPPKEPLKTRLQKQTPKTAESNQHVFNTNETNISDGDATENTILISGMDDIPQCKEAHLASKEIEEKQNYVMSEMQKNWRDYKQHQDPSLQQRIDFLIHGVDIDISAMDQVDLISAHLAAQPNDEYALNYLIDLCKTQQNQLVCHENLPALIQQNANAFITLQYAQLQLVQDNTETAIELFKQATNKSRFDDLYKDFSRRAEQFYLTNSPASEINWFLTFNGFNYKRLDYFALRNSCQTDLKYVDNGELCFDLGLLVAENTSGSINSVIGHLILGDYFQNKQMNNHFIENNKKVRQKMAYTDYIGKILNHAVFDDRLKFALIDPAYDHNETLRFEKLAEQLVDYYQDPNYNPCQAQNSDN